MNHYDDGDDAQIAAMKLLRQKLGVEVEQLQFPHLVEDNSQQDKLWKVRRNLPQVAGRRSRAEELCIEQI